MGTCVHFSRSLLSNSWWQTMAGSQALSRPPAAEGGGRRPAFTGLATQPYSATEVDGWQHKTQPGGAAFKKKFAGTCRFNRRVRVAAPAAREMRVRGATA